MNDELAQSHSPSPIGLIGLGLMGCALAERLLEHGYRVAVWASGLERLGMTRGNSLSWHSLAVGFSPATEVASWAGSFFPRREALKVAAASRSYLCLNADGAGDRKLRFPKAAEVFDPFTGERLARRVTNFTRTLQNRETLLIRYKT